MILFCYHFKISKILSILVNFKLLLVRFFASGNHNLSETAIPIPRKHLLVVCPFFLFVYTKIMSIFSII